jgi:hypothetical protein
MLLSDLGPGRDALRIAIELAAEAERRVCAAAVAVITLADDSIARAELAEAEEFLAGARDNATSWAEAILWRVGVKGEDEKWPELRRALLADPDAALPDLEAVR